MNYEAKITDLSTGKSFTIPSTKEEMSVEVTSESHPFYTGQHRIVDTENLVKKFEEKRHSAAGKTAQNRKVKRLNRKRNKTGAISTGKTLTLKDMLSQLN